MATQVQIRPNDLIRRYQGAPPVDVKKMAEDLGLRVFNFDVMPRGASGKLYPDPSSDAGWSIGVNASDSPTRKRFTIAHEIAHFLLHRQDIRGGVIDDPLYRSEHLSGGQEAEANRFAADILMPYGLLEEFASRGITNIERLARAFGVSTQAMKIRLGIPLP